MSEKPRCRILVVEDEALIAILVEDMVVDFGSEVVGPAGQLADALNFARYAELDAAILDINVSGSVVFPVADVLRERRIPLIFATGYGTNGLPPRYQNSPTLSKPFNYQIFAETLRTILAGQPCHTELA